MVPNTHITEQICPRCASNVTAAGDNRCPVCGAKLKNRLVNGAFRTGLWVFFWLVFLGTPAFFFLTMPLDTLPNFWPLVVGAVASGVILSLLVTRSALALIPWVMLFTIGFCAVYVGILFVGCLVLANQKH
jgi:hypothetical protein